MSAPVRLTVTVDMTLAPDATAIKFRAALDRAIDELRVLCDESPRLQIELPDMMRRARERSSIINRALVQGRGNVEATPDNDVEIPVYEAAE